MVVYSFIYEENQSLNLFSPLVLTIELFIKKKNCVYYVYLYGFYKCEIIWYYV